MEILYKVVNKQPLSNIYVKDGILSYQAYTNWNVQLPSITSSRRYKIIAQ